MADFDVAVIGAGPGGYVAAICAARQGLKIALIEKEAAGGLCLNWGCIPSKILLKDAAVYWRVKKMLAAGRLAGEVSPNFTELIGHSREKVDGIRAGLEQLIKSNKVSLISGTARFVSANTLEVAQGDKKETINAKNIIIAAGSEPKTLPQFEIDGRFVITSREALALRQLPGTMIIVGGGVIGCEMATFFSAFGTKVTVLEYMPQLLPGTDADISGALGKSFAARGIDVKLSSRIAACKKTESGVEVMMESGESYAAGVVLVAVGIQGKTAGLAIEAAGVNTARSFVLVDSASYRTNVSGIYAIGDIAAFADRPHPALAHVASCEGEIVAEVIAQGKASWAIDYDNIPLTIFTDPEIGTCGLSEEEAGKRLEGHSVIVQKTPEKIMGVAMALEETDGITKVIVDKSDFGRILGAHIIGPSATERIHVWTAVRRAGESAYAMAHQIMAHPTFSEVFRESLLALDGRAVHVPLMLQSGKRVRRDSQRRDVL